MKAEETVDVEVSSKVSKAGRSQSGSSAKLRLLP